MKDTLKLKAIHLRKSGKTYGEILRLVPVAKSTLSLWLRSVNLANEQRQRITQKRIDAQKRGAEARRRIRSEEIERTVSDGIKEISAITSRELWLIGIALYWAEGAKQNERHRSTSIRFDNSDVRMHSVFLKWLMSLSVPISDIRFHLYVHENRKVDTTDFKHWWITQLSLPRDAIKNVYYKKGNPKTNRKNTADLYHGLMRITVRRSTSLNRKVNGWVAGIVTSLGDGVTGNTSAFEAEDSRIVP